MTTDTTLHDLYNISEYILSLNFILFVYVLFFIRYLWKSLTSQVHIDSILKEINTLKYVVDF